MTRSSTRVEHQYINLDLRRQNRKLGGKIFHHHRSRFQGLRQLFSPSVIFRRGVAIEPNLDSIAGVFFSDAN